jgi:hypothetical protein
MMYRAATRKKLSTIDADVSATTTTRNSGAPLLTKIDA